MVDDVFFRMEQFKQFHKLLMANAPKDYIPWYIPVIKEGKAVDGRIIYSKAPTLKSCCDVEWVTIHLNNGRKKTICKKCGRTKGSWKQLWARLTFEQALGLIRARYNIGLAAREFDDLVIIDIDNFKYVKELPLTLTNKSRKRSGLHGFFWSKEKIPNIPTEDDGEVRSQDQYVIVSGYVPTSNEEIEKEFFAEHITKEEKSKILRDVYKGYYTLEKGVTPNWISYEELPAFFKEANVIQNTIPNKAKLKTDTQKTKNSKHSALFDLTIRDIVSVNLDERVGHPLHASDTSANFSVSADCDDLAHCWRHNVSLNALQFLVVKSGYMDCCSAGTGHKGGNPSNVVNDDGAIFHAWLQAKRDRLIPVDDPLPYRAMCYIALKYKLCAAKELPNRDGKKSIPLRVYNKVLEIVENEY